MAMAYLNGVKRKSKMNGWIEDAAAEFDPFNPGSAASNAIDSASDFVAEFDPSNPGSVANNFYNDVKDAVQKGLTIVAKIGIAPARAAFIGLVKINNLKLAKRLAQAYQSSPQAGKDIRDMWEKKFKGNWSTLRQAINQGASTSISGRKYKPGDIVGGQVLGTDGIWHDIKKGTRVGGIDPVTAGLITAAIPLIIAFIGLIKKKGTDKPGEGELDAELIRQGARTLLENPDTNIEIDGNPVTSNVPFYKNPMVLGVGAVAIVGGYMLMKRRK
jgi:hypothetical protein